MLLKLCIMTSCNSSGYLLPRYKMDIYILQHLFIRRLFISSINAFSHWS